jgi:HlyD family secretion protein
MSKSRWLIVIVAVSLALAGWWAYGRNGHEKESPYRFATVERGDIEATVAATGSLGAVTTVQVGTQVSGQISAIYADFNDQVKKGQLLARVDPVLLQQAVEEGLAGVERSQAQLDAAKREYDRNQRLFSEKLIPESEITNYQSTYEVAKANLTSARVSLDRAKRNLGYTDIYSPIDGVIVERNVDVGQTVAASLSAPQLFLIANDLSRMQILASVGESDIGSIVEGQQVRFTVQTYPNEHFTGTVRQVRLQSKTVENVVNYTVVVEVENKDGRLLPGMTASVDFLTGAATDVLLVPNAALRFRPTEAMMAEMRANRMAAGNGANDSATPGPEGGRRFGRNGGDSGGPRGSSGGGSFGGPGGGGPPGMGGMFDRVRAGGGAILWYVDDLGKLAIRPVRLGLTDGQRTEVKGEGLTEGMAVIIGTVLAADQTSAQPASPFQGPSPSGGSRFRGPGGF